MGITRAYRGLQRLRGLQWVTRGDRVLERSQKVIRGYTRLQRGDRGYKA